MKYGITVLNSGTIDSDYRGEVSVLLVNLGNEIFFNRGDRIAQIVFKSGTSTLEEVEELDESDRGTGGYGSYVFQKSKTRG